MRITYQVAIGESVEELRAHDQRLRGKKAALRWRMLVLRNSGPAKTMEAVAPLVGYSCTQVVRWWTRYRTEGLAGRERAPHDPGVTPRVTPEARADRHAAMRRGEMAT